MTIETIVRPFQNPGVTPIPFTQAGAQGVPNVKLQVGAVGGSKVFPWSLSATSSSYMSRIHREKPNVQQLMGGGG
jgi:hypothetical protein